MSVATYATPKLAPVTAWTLSTIALRLGKQGPVTGRDRLGSLCAGFSFALRSARLRMIVNGTMMDKHKGSPCRLPASLSPV